MKGLLRRCILALFVCTLLASSMTAPRLTGLYSDGLVRVSNIEADPPKTPLKGHWDAGGTGIRGWQLDTATGDFTRIRICGKDLFKECPRDDNSEGHGVSPRAHWRRGHWRRQRHGAGLSLVTPRWIRPTIVKQDNGPLVETRLYDVQADAGAKGDPSDEKG